MFGRSPAWRDDVPQNQEVEEVSDDEPQTQKPNFSDDLSNSIQPIHKDDAFMLIDSNGDIWLAVYNGTELAVTPAKITPMVVT